MAAIVTDQFRILNASNFIDSVVNTNNSYYVFLGLSNPVNAGFGRTTTWDTNIPNPTDNLDYSSHYKDTALFGKKITSSNIRRVVRYVKWTANTSYDMYRHDYSISNPTPNSNLSRLYDSNFYVINTDYRVYICIYNGSSTENLKGNKSQDEPTFTDLDPSSAGQSGDGYIWKYLFSISPSDIIKFDSTEYIVVPNDWKTSTNSEIVSIRENGYSSSTNPNQIKQVYISNGGSGYSSGIVDIIGDGTGGKVSITVDSTGKITSTQVTAGGYGYSWAIVDLGNLQPQGGSIPNPAKLIPIIPPSKGHGYDIYTELGTDKILIYARFDDSTKDFPTDTKFSQVGIIKNPTIPSSDSVIFTENQYSTLSGIGLTSTFSGSPTIGQEITQTVTGGTARGYVASYDKETKVLKYFRDRSLYFGNNLDQTDYNTVSSESKVLAFESSSQNIGGSSPSFTAAIDTSFANNGNKITVGGKVIDLGVTFTGGLSNPEINTKSGEIIYIDNRPLVTRDIRQKEDIKIILEF